MDLLTQGLLGSVTARSAAAPEETRAASVIGFCAGLLADADVLIQSADNPLLQLDYHRHFTHALIFIPAGAALAALLLLPFFRKKLSFKKIYFYSLMGYLFSGLLDACTSYGTHLYWPFSDTRVALHLISIVDPIFTGILISVFIIALLSILRSRTNANAPRIARIALALCAGYLLLSFAQQKRVATAVQQLADSRGHQPQRRIVKPSFGNTLLWRSVYIADERIYVDALRAGLAVQTYPGEAVARYRPATDAQEIARDSRLYADILRFEKFSDGFIGIHPCRPQILGDMRYSMLPNEARPLWGIVLDPASAAEHARFESFRKLSPAERQRFTRMLRGNL